MAITRHKLPHLYIIPCTSICIHSLTLHFCFVSNGELRNDNLKVEAIYTKTKIFSEFIFRESKDKLLPITLKENKRMTQNKNTKESLGSKKKKLMIKKSKTIIE